MARSVWPALALAGVLLGTSTPTAAQGPPPASGGSEGQTILSQEVGDRDLTYLRTRAVFRYDYKDQVSDATANRLRVKALYAFGPQQRLAVSVMAPFLRKDTRDGSATGAGDAELEAGGNFFYRDRFRTGVACQLTFRTAGADPLGARRRRSSRPGASP